MNRCKYGLFLVGVISVGVAAILFLARKVQTMENAPADVNSLSSSCRELVYNVKSTAVLLLTYCVLAAAFLHMPPLLHVPVRYDEAVTFTECA